MNDLITCACCHISDKIGRNENRSALAPAFIGFDFVIQGESAQASYRFAAHLHGQLEP